MVLDGFQDAGEVELEDAEDVVVTGMLLEQWDIVEMVTIRTTRVLQLLGAWSFGL